MKLKILVLMVGLLLTSSVYAQRCPPLYARGERDEIKQILANTITPMLARLNEISYLGATSAPLVQLKLETHRQAFNNEYQAYLMEIDRFLRYGDEVLRLRPRSQAFLRNVASVQALGLKGTSLVGDDDADAEANSRLVHDRTRAALTTIWSCL